MNPFIEIGHQQRCKHGQTACGDLFLSRRLQQESRIIAVLADGLGSGIKASVLSTLTGAMAAACVRGNMGIERTAEVILSALPVCRDRGLAYSTFSIVDIDMATGIMRIIEHENPPFILIRDERLFTPVAEHIPLKNAALSSRHHELLFTEIKLQEGDRVLFFSDGITQSGLGRDHYPQGWGVERVREETLRFFQSNPDISAQNLADKIIQRAWANDSFTAKDDITCAALYYRQPRHLLVATGPPYDAANDALVARRVRDFQGRTMICGGTTAALVARGMGRELQINHDDLNAGVPPTSSIEGVDLVTEGTLTLEEILRTVDTGNPQINAGNAAGRAADMMLHSDRIHFIVGSRINNAHQDPRNPRQLDLRRNMISKLRHALEARHLKETTMELV